MHGEVLELEVFFFGGTLFEFRDDQDIFQKTRILSGYRRWRNHDASFVGFDTIPGCDGQTDKQTDGKQMSSDNNTSACIACYATRLSRKLATRKPHQIGLHLSNRNTDLSQENEIYNVWTSEVVYIINYRYCSKAKYMNILISQL